eukprot:TRINITY_DN14232_c0_g1_i4.p1 TRINITY_DN14232_c0_g1~~TRINITY_DN14232_c0_g1_i4.p1  ORF type:complete len:277 (-),score=59.19 TRINITY_DN14232_c0_g1_i4:112-942(-)
MKKIQTSLSFSNFTVDNVTELASNLTVVANWLATFVSWRSGVVAKNSNLNETLFIAILLFSDGATFLRQVVRNGYEADLVLVGQAIQDYPAFAGQQLGLLLADSFGTTVSHFLKGLANGFDLSLDLQYLVDKRFDNSTANITDIANVLSLLGTNPFGPIKTIQLVLLQFNFDIRSIQRTRPADVVANQNLSQLFNTYLPTVFQDIKATLQVIQDNNYLDYFSRIADVIPGDIEEAGLRLGTALNLIYDDLTATQEAERETPLKQLLRLSRANMTNL